ncbi:MAG: DNA gyrase inhibitor YacG [Sphingomonas sp.]|nr:DNA gyrase inhibitor YacG [Sphingomonas sp.]
MSTVPKTDACPLCGKLAAQAFRPFCSQGCRDRDLLNWLGDAYRVPGPPAEDAVDSEGLDRHADPPL